MNDWQWKRSVQIQTCSGGFWRRLWGRFSHSVWLDTKRLSFSLWLSPITRKDNNAHQNRTIAIASDFRVDGAKSPELPQKEGVWGSEIAARNRRSLATFHRTLKSQCIIALSCLRNRAISGVRDGHRNRKSQKSLRFRCAKKDNNAWNCWNLSPEDP